MAYILACVPIGQLVLLLAFQSCVLSSSVVRVLKYGDALTLDCTTDYDRVFKHWVTPDLEVVSANFSYPRRKVVLLRENNSVHIPAVEPALIGDYLCVGENLDGKPVYDRTAVFFYYPPVWEAYYHNFVTALSSAAVFLAVASLFYFVHYYRSRRAIVALQVPPDGALIIATVTTGTGNGLGIACGGAVTTVECEVKGVADAEKTGQHGGGLKALPMQELTDYESAVLLKAGDKEPQKPLETLM